MAWACQGESSSEWGLSSQSNSISYYVEGILNRDTFYVRDVSLTSCYIGVVDGYSERGSSYKGFVFAIKFRGLSSQMRGGHGGLLTR
eukprot:5302462-Amphidinium_carterae.1